MFSATNIPSYHRMTRSGTECGHLDGVSQEPVLVERCLDTGRKLSDGGLLSARGWFSVPSSLEV